MHQPQTGRPFETRERSIELPPGPVLLDVEVTDQLTHGQHRPRARPLSHHLPGEPAHRPALHLSVLETAQDVLQTLEVAHYTLARTLGQDRRAHLQRITQLLAPLPQLVQVLRRRVGPDGDTTPRHPPVRPEDTTVGPLPARQVFQLRIPRRTDEPGQLRVPRRDQPPERHGPQRAHELATFQCPPTCQIYRQKIQ